MVKAAGYEQYADKISNLEQALAEVNRDLKAPNAAIDLTSSSLGKAGGCPEHQGHPGDQAGRPPPICSPMC